MNKNQGMGFVMNSVAKLSVALSLSIALQAHAAEFLVKYKSANTFSMMSFQSYQMTILDQHEPGRLLKVDISDKNKVTTLAKLFANPNVEYVVPNGKFHAFTTPIETTILQDQWAVSKVQAAKAWERAGNKGSRNVLLSVIDTGVDYKHKNLAQNMVAGGWDFVKNDGDPMDVTGQNPGHGTHCAGIVGATGLIDAGTVGISPEVSIMPIRFLDENGSGSFENAVKAIDYAISKNVQVISASWGAAIDKSQAQPLIEAMKRAEKAGIVFVVAAANDGKSNDTTDVFPANAGLSNTISVAASDSSDAKPSWSNYGRAKVNKGMAEWLACCA